ncbi:hypothetical protein [Pseudonocardia adelaidensis]|uniref:Uncharacterized protein n=1 Tax=Pseudonocardia adelaidensis TaxID=648754 RepID=A0ABP9P4S8_9PSEU
MPTTHRRERYGRYRIRNIAADACRYVELVDDHAELDCPRCAQTLRGRRTDTDVFREGGPLWSVLLDHLLHDCPAVEVAR